MIQFNHVSKRYFGQDAYALDDVSFHIDPHEFVFLVGPSGSGKSTVLRLLTGEVEPSSGSILSCDRQLESLTKRQRPAYLRELGVVFQDFRLIQTMTVFENLAFARRVHGVHPYLVRRRVMDLLEQLDLTRFANRYPFQLSGGEQQRVAIARSLMNCPKIILADEPTGNLDPDFSLRIMKLFEQVNRDDELDRPAIFIITHEEQLVDSMNKRVIRLKEGRIQSDLRKGGYRFKEET